MKAFRGKAFSIGAVGLMILVSFAILVATMPTISANAVTAISPTSGQIVKGTVNFQCTSVGATSVELRIDGTLIATMTGGPPTWSYSVDTSGWTDGSHMVRYDSYAGPNVISFPVKFDNNGPEVSNGSAVYDSGNTAVSSGDTVRIRATCVDSVSGMYNVTVNASNIGGKKWMKMYDDGLHADGSTNDGTYGSDEITVSALPKYGSVYVWARDVQGNFRNKTVEVDIDNFEPTIMGIDVLLPAGQVAVKNGDQIRVVANAFDYKIEIINVVVREPVDVVLAIDNSGSMSGTKWADLETAATKFIDSLANNDRCAIYAFNLQGGGSYESTKRYQPFYQMDQVYTCPVGDLTDTGRNLSKHVVTKDDGSHLTTNYGSPACNTPIWDTVGDATTYCINNHLTDHVPVAIAMTDGDDYGSGWDETGSETYCPGSPNGATGRTWAVSGGCYWGSATRTYTTIQREQDTSTGNAYTSITFSGDEKTRTGLINCTIPVFTIGLGNNPQGSNASAGGYLNPTTANYKYTTEFDLREIGNSSAKGRYYYAPSSNQLTAIYNNISKAIQKFGVNTLGKTAPHGIKKVEVDLSAVGISQKVTMFDDGEHGDSSPNDDIYGSALVTVNSVDTGKIIFSVEGTDIAGNTNDTINSLYLDNVQPTIKNVTVAYPPGRTTAQDGYSIYVSGFTNDTQSGVGRVYLDASSIGGGSSIPMNDEGTGNDADAFDGNYTSENFTIATGLISGTYTFTVDAYDQAENLAQHSGNIEINNGVDIIMGTLVVGDIISGNYPLVVNITDPDGIPDSLTNPRYRIDANPWYDMTVTTGTNFGATIDTSKYLDGPHTIYVNARDVYGAETTLDANFKIDNTAPSLSTVISPISGQYVNGLYSFKATAIDAIGLKNVTVSIKNETGVQKVINASMGYNSGTGYYEYVFGTSTQNDGVYNVTVYARDYVGHCLMSASVFFNIDNSYPVMTLNSPKDSQIVSGVVPMNISVNEKFLSKVEYNVDNSGWVDYSTPWNTTRINDGSHTVRIRVTDQASHEVTETIYVIVDNHDPVCALSLPSQNQFIEGIYVLRSIASDQVGLDSVEVVVVNTDSNTTTLNTTMGYNAGTGYFEAIFDTKSAADGNYNATVYATDKAENRTTSIIVSFHIDNNAPTLTINSPLEGDIVEGLTTLNITISEEPFLQTLQYNIDSSGWVNVSVAWNTQIIVDGEHVIDLRAKDKAGHEILRQITVIVDNGNPEAYIVSPTNSEYISGTHVFKISARDTVGIDRATFYLFSAPYNATYNTQSSCYEVTIDTTIWGDGSDLMTGIIYDLSGKFVTVGPRQYHIDNHAPEIDINYPIEMNYVEGEVSFDVNVRDNFKALSVCEYNVDNKGWIALDQDTTNSTLTYTKFVGNWNTTLLIDGPHAVDIRARDPADHVTSYVINVIVDNNAPTCEIHTPIENQYMEKLVTFRVVASDAVGIANVVMHLFNTEVNATYNSQTGYYEYTADTRVILEDGIQSIWAQAIDLSNKSVMDGPVTFNVDNTAPALAINSPGSGDYVNQTVYINATTLDAFPLPTEYNVDSAGWHDIGVPWDTTKTNDGEHIISIRARDAMGHETVETITVIVDNHFPLCTIHNPSVDQFVEGAVTFKVLATDTLGIEAVELTIFVGTPFEKKIGATYNSVTNYYEYTQSLYGIMDGTYYVGVSTLDLSHNRVTLDNLRFRVDSHNPKLIINHLSNGDYYTGNVMLNVTAMDSFEVSIEYNVDNGGWQSILPEGTVWDTTVFKDGEHQIQLRATDEAGHSITQSVSVYVDNSAPEVSIVSPRAGEHLTGVYTVKAYCHDALDLQLVTFGIGNATPEEIFLNPMTGLYEIPMDTTTLPDGTYTFIVTARDHVGYENAPAMVNVYFNNEGPEFNIGTVPTQGKGHIEFNISDSKGEIDQMYINIDGSGWKEMGYDGTTSTFHYIWYTTTDDNGKHTYQIRAVDQYGNEQFQSGTIEVKNKKEVNYLSIFYGYVPLILFILLILFIAVVVIVLIRTGTVKKWIKPEPKPEEKKEDEEVEEEGEHDETEEGDDKEDEDLGEFFDTSEEGEAAHDEEEAEASEDEAKDEFNAEDDAPKGEKKATETVKGEPADKKSPKPKVDKKTKSGTDDGAKAGEGKKPKRQDDTSFAPGAQPRQKDAASKDAKTKKGKVVKKPKQKDEFVD